MDEAMQTELLARPLDRALARIPDGTPDGGVSAARAVLRVLQGGRGLASVIGAAHQLADKFTAPTRAGAPPGSRCVRAA